jgi:hypothetical protein
MSKMRSKKFSEKEYLAILEKFDGYWCEFGNDKNIPVYLRHDVEADLDKACQIAKLNKSRKVRGLFTLQVVSEFYNINSEYNKKIIKEILDNEQEIGLHYYSSYRESDDFDFQDYQYQANILNNFLKTIGGNRFRCFSYHRPTKKQLEKSAKGECPSGYIDCYSGKYFELTDEPHKARKKYMSDSDHEWRYGYPLECDIENFDCIQILMHPEEWFFDTADSVYKNIEDIQIAKIQMALNTEYKKYSMKK